MEHESCKQSKQSYKEYYKTAENWFNRNKAKIFGTHLFYPVIFKHILKVCTKIKGLQNNQQMVIFIDLLMIILNDNIEFRKTKCQPLILYQSLHISNTFKTNCRKLVKYYNVKWDEGDPIKICNVYQKDKQRAKRIFDSFIIALTKIRNKLSNAHYQYPYFNPHSQQIPSIQFEDIEIYNIKQEKDIFSSSVISHNTKQIKEEIPTRISPTSSTSPDYEQLTNNDNQKNTEHQKVMKDENVQFHNLELPIFDIPNPMSRSDSLENMVTNNDLSGLAQSPQITNISYSNNSNKAIGNIPVHFIENGQTKNVQMINNERGIENIDISSFVKIERDEANNTCYGYKIESMSDDKGTMVIKQYVLFPNQ